MHIFCNLFWSSVHIRRYGFIAYQFGLKCFGWCNFQPISSKRYFKFYMAFDCNCFKTGKLNLTYLKLSFSLLLKICLWSKNDTDGVLFKLNHWDQTCTTGHPEITIESVKQDSTLNENSPAELKSDLRWTTIG